MLSKTTKIELREPPLRPDAAMTRDHATSGITFYLNFVHKKEGKANSNLRENGHVDGDLEGAADEELGRRVAQVEVGRLEGVAAHPHQHHLHAEIEYRRGRYSAFRQLVWKVL